MTEDVIVTGWGLIWAGGSDPADLFNEPQAGLSMHARFELFSEGLGTNGEGALVVRMPGPDPSGIPGLKRPFPDRVTLAAIAAADLARASAHIEGATIDGDRAGIVANTCYGAAVTVERYLRSLLTEGPGHVSGITFARTVSNAMVGELARRYQYRGPSSLLLGGSALGYARDLLTDGKADLILCVGVDILSDYPGWCHHHAGMLDNGMILGEVGAALVLERAASARARGAYSGVRLLDYGASFCPQAVQRITDFTEVSIQRSIAQALSRSEISGSSIDLVVSLDNGDRSLAAVEAAAARKLLNSALQVLAPKRLTGECFGASEVLGAVVAAKYLSDKTQGCRYSLVNSGQLGGAVSTMAFEGFNT